MSEISTAGAPVIGLSCTFEAGRYSVPDCLSLSPFLRMRRRRKRCSEDAAAFCLQEA